MKYVNAIFFGIITSAILYGYAQHKALKETFIQTTAEQMASAVCHQTCMKCLKEVEQTNRFGRKTYTCTESVYVGKEKCEPDAIKMFKEELNKKLNKQGND